jgi:L-lactate utilization protein LutB
MDTILKTQKSLERLGYTVKVFDGKEQATDYLASSLQGKTIGLGGSVSIGQMGLYERLQESNTVLWHLRLSAGDDVMQVRKDAARAEVYITSVNGISEAGEIVNIDNTGNRVAAATFGCEKVYFVVGKNKIAPTLEAAIDRARNIAAPLNAKRLGLKTPCAVRGDKCYDCDSPQRICRNLSVFWKKPTGCEYEVLLINEALGY